MDRIFHATGNWCKYIDGNIKQSWLSTLDYVISSLESLGGWYVFHGKEIKFDCVHFLYVCYLNSSSQTGLVTVQMTEICSFEPPSTFLTE